MDPLRVVGTVHGWYYIVTGAWPLLSSGTFQLVTGPKQDLWIAQTVGLLLVVCGGVLALAARANRITSEIVLLAVGLAVTLGIVDLICVRQPRTTWAYLLDAPVELAFAVGWLLYLRRRGSGG